MRNVWLLLKVQLLSISGINRARYYQDARKRPLKIAMLAFIYLAMLSLLPAFFFYGYSVALGLDAMGILDQFPSVMLAMACALTLVTTLFKTNGMLFGSRDDDMVLPLPVRPEEITAARLLLMYSLDALFTIAVMLSSGFAYWLLAKPSAAYWPIFALTMLTSPLIPLVIGAIAGALLSRLAAGFNNRYAKLIVLTAAMLVYMGFALNVSEMESRLTNIGLVMGQAIERVYPLAGLYRRAVCDADIIAALGYSALNIAAFVLLALALGKCYTRLNSFMSTSHSKGKYRMGALKTASPLKALYFKELKRYFTCTIYVFNTGFGLVLAVAGAIALAVKGVDSIAAAMEIPGLAEFLKTGMGSLLAFAISFMVATACTTSASISLEGKNLWLMKSLPVPAWKILASKLLVNLTLTLPTILIVGVICDFLLPIDNAQAVLVYLLPVGYALFIALLGLLVNLKMHRFDWINETVIVKQSLSTFLPVLVGLATTIAPIALAIMHPELGTLVGWCALAVTLALSAAIAVILKTRGEAMIRAL